MGENARKAQKNGNYFISRQKIHVKVFCSYDSAVCTEYISCICNCASGNCKEGMSFPYVTLSLSNKIPSLGCRRRIFIACGECCSGDLVVVFLMGFKKCLLDLDIWRSG